MIISTVRNTHLLFTKVRAESDYLRHTDTPMYSEMLFVYMHPVLIKQLGKDSIFFPGNPLILYMP